MRPGSGKRRAVSYELKRYKTNIAAHYFGDEVTRGNDREVLYHPGVKVWTVGEKPVHDECEYVGQRPHDLFHLVAQVLARSLEA